MSKENTDTNTAVDDADSDSHLEAAIKFFSEAGNDDQQQSSDDQQQSSDDQQPAVEIPVSDVLDLGGDDQQQQQQQQRSNDDTKSVEVDLKDLEGLQAPDDKSKFKPDWDKMKGIVRQEREARAKLEAELKKVRESSAPNEALTKAQARIQELEAAEKILSDRLKVFDLKNHPDYIKAIDEPRNAAIAEMKELVDDADIAEQLPAILALPQKELAKKLSDIATDLPDYTRTKLYSLVDTVRGIDRKAAEMLKNVDAVRQTITQQNHAQDRKALDEVTREFFGGKLFKQQTVPEGASDEVRAEVEAYNAELSKLASQAAARALGGGDSKQVALTAAEAVAFQFMVKRALPRINKLTTQAIAARDAKIKELTDRIQSLEKSGRLGTGGGGGRDKGSKTEAEMSHLEAAKKYFPV